MVHYIVYINMYIVNILISSFNSLKPYYDAWTRCPTMPKNYTVSSQKKPIYSKFHPNQSDGATCAAVTKNRFLQCTHIYYQNSNRLRGTSKRKDLFYIILILLGKVKITKHLSKMDNTKICRNIMLCQKESCFFRGNSMTYTTLLTKKTAEL